MTPRSKISDVAQNGAISPSAAGVAYLRAIHEELSEDPLAKYFVTPEGEALARKWLQNVPCVGREVALRNRWFDSEVAAAVNAGIDQVVQVAAGLSSFPWRHAAVKNIKRYAEFDRDEMVKFKERAIAELIKKGVVAPSPSKIEWRSIDLATDGLEPNLRSLSWSFNKPTLFVFEGISYYLPHERFIGLVQEIERISTKGSRIAFDYFHDETEDLPSLERVMGSIAPAGGEASWRRISSSKIEGVLSKWNILTHESIAEKAKREDVGDLMNYVSVVSAILK